MVYFFDGPVMFTPLSSATMAELLQKIFNSFALAMMLVAAAASIAISESAVFSPTFLMVASLPLAAHLVAERSSAPSGMRMVSMAVNWVAAVLAASLAAVTLTGLGPAVGTSPFLAAAVIYAWNAVSIATASP